MLSFVKLARASVPSILIVPEASIASTGISSRPSQVAPAPPATVAPLVSEFSFSSLSRLRGTHAGRSMPPFVRVN